MEGRIEVAGKSISFFGRFTVKDLGSVTRALEKLPSEVIVPDFAECIAMDTGIAARVWSFYEDRIHRGKKVYLNNTAPDIRSVFDRFEEIDKVPPPFMTKKNLKYHFSDIGDKVADSWDTLSGLFSFSVKAFKALFSGRVRGSMTAYYMEQSGVMAVPIVVTPNWLMGVVLGYQVG